MSSQITHTQSSIRHPLAHILDNCSFIFSSCTIFTLYPNCILYRYPTPLLVIIIIAREGSPKEHRAKQKWPRETQSVTYAPGLSTHSNLSCIFVQPPPSFPCCPRPPSHYPSKPQSTSHPPSNYFCHQHPFFPYAQTYPENILPNNDWLNYVHQAMSLVNANIWPCANQFHFCVDSSSIAFW